MAPAVTAYLDSLVQLSRTIESDHEQVLANFAVLCLETSHYLVITNAVSPRELELCLKCAKSILSDFMLSRAFGKNTWICSAAASLTEIVRYLSDERQIDEVYQCSGLEQTLENEETRDYAVACLRMAKLVSWLERRRRIGKDDEMPDFFEELLRGLIIDVARQPLVNSFVLTPPLLWKHGCNIVGSGPTK